MAETWVLNESLDPVLQLPKTTISFTSNGQAYAAISYKNRKLVYYINPYSSSGTTAYEYSPWGTQEHWTNSVYRTVVFDSAPTGSLLRWLQENATKQVEPEPTIPKNVCLIDDIGYSIKQGKVLIDGTAYTVKKGRTLIDGTGYDIKLSSMCTIVFSGSGDQFNHAEINGVNYRGSSGSIEVEAGTICTLVADSGRHRFAIIVNGVTVSNKSGMTRYAYTIDSDCTIAFAMSNITVTTQ